MSWYYAQNDKHVGPVDENSLPQLIAVGTINRQTSIWKEGMPDWIPAGSSEIGYLFVQSPSSGSIPPPHPQPHLDSPNSFGARLDPSRVYPSIPPKSVNICWLGILFPGLPQLVLGQIGKGVIMLVLAIFMLWIPLIFVSVIDARKVAQTLAAGESVGKWSFFPSPNS